jgi:hypothetical protein
MRDEPAAGREVANDVAPMTAWKVRPARSLMELRHAATDRLTIVYVPERRLFVIDGMGSPFAADFEAASRVLRLVASTLRANLTNSRLSVVERIGALECLWWHTPPVDPADVPRLFEERTDWRWRQMIAIPERATDADVDRSIDQARRRAGRRGRLVRAALLDEGVCAQLLHVGGSGTEPATIGRLLRAIDESGLRPRDSLHELRVADERDVAPGRARSILRVPVAPALAVPVDLPS